MAEPHTGRGHHYFPRRWAEKIPFLTAITDTPMFVLNPPGITKGQMNWLHFVVDPRHKGGTLRRKGGLIPWSGEKLGYKKHNLAGRVWYGAPRPLKATVGMGQAMGTLGGPFLEDDGE